MCLGLRYVVGRDSTDKEIYKNGQPLWIWSCSGMSNQLWSIGAPSTLSITYWANSNMCLGVDGNATNGAGISLQQCNQKAAQQWTFALGSWRIQYAADPTKCIGLPQGLTHNGNKATTTTG